MPSADSAMSYYHGRNSPPASSGAATPNTANSASSSGLFGGALYSALGGLVRRWSSDPNGAMHGGGQHRGAEGYDDDDDDYNYRDDRNAARTTGNGIDHFHEPWRPKPRHANTRPRVPSPLQPPPLDPLVLHGFRDDTPESARLMTAPVAEEIRIMVPERLRIEEDWRLVYSLDQDGASLATLYEKCAPFRGRRGGFVLVVRDDDGGTFGAYLSEAPHVAPHYFGNGECFLWRASLMAPLPPPPSADTTNLDSRTTTIAATAPSAPSFSSFSSQPSAPRKTSFDLLGDDGDFDAMSRMHQPQPQPQQQQPLPTSPSIRFKAFPYSGVNEYYVYCEPHWLSVGGGDGKYGLWLDDSLEKGISATCLTFGNEPLSDEGEKFGVLGVELWAIGAKD